MAGISAGGSLAGQAELRARCLEPLRYLAAAVSRAKVQLEVNHWPGFLQAAKYEGALPPELRALLESKDTPDAEKLAKLEAWARERAGKFLARWLQTNDGRFLSVMMAFSGESDFRKEEAALLRTVGPDVAVFAPGHGSPGGEEFSAQVFLTSGTPIVRENHFQFKISGDDLIKAYAASKGVKQSKVILFSSCNAGLPKEATEQSAEVSPAAQRLAKESGVPVIAPMANLAINLVEGKLRVFVIDPDTNRRLPADKAFQKFFPDGRPPEPITFEQAKKELIRPEAAATFNYAPPAN